MSLVDTINRTARKVPTWPVYVLGTLPPIWYFYLGVTGQLGVEPIAEMEHELGLLALQGLIAGLAITPLRRYANVNLIKFRRSVGLVTFYWIACHLAVWLILDVGIWSQIWGDILKRPYITLGMIGFLLLIPLAVTSNAVSIRKLGPAWRRLHKLVYPAVLLGGIHFLMVRKGFQIEPLVYLVIIGGLLALRLPVIAKRPRRARA